MATEDRQAKTESDVIELKMVTAKIGDAVAVLTEIVARGEKEKSSSLQRALGIIVSGMIIIGGVVGGASYLVGASQDAKSAVREHRLTELERQLRESTVITYQWKTTTEAK